MADALKEAPLKTKNGVKETAALKMLDEFDVNKKYVFELAERVMPRDKPVINVRTNRIEPDPEFPPYRNLILTSQIVWNGSRTNIRYYDGCESIFVSEQPKEKDTVDQLIQQSKKRAFLKGKLIVEGYDKMLLFYLNICSWNGESKFRTNTANAIFISVNPDKKATVDTEKMDNIEKALDLAKAASESKMLIHANYLGIATIDFDSGNDLSPKEIRSAYRKYALANADDFISSYGNKSIEIKYYIDKALLNGIIDNKLNPNQAVWSKSGSIICDVSGLISVDAISERLFEFSQSDEGEEFLIQLKAIYS